MSFNEHLKLRKHFSAVADLAAYLLLSSMSYYGRLDGQAAEPDTSASAESAPCRVPLKSFRNRLETFGSSPRYAEELLLSSSSLLLKQVDTQTIEDDELLTSNAT